MNRRGFLGLLLAAPVAFAARKYFLPPRGGWRRDFYVDVDFTATHTGFTLNDFEERILRPAMERMAKAIDADIVMRAHALADMKFYGGQQWPQTMIESTQREIVIQQAGEPIEFAVKQRVNWRRPWNVPGSIGG